MRSFVWQGLAAVGMAGALAGQASAANLTQYPDLASFQAAIVPPPAFQDFESFAHEAIIGPGVEIVLGLNMSTNLDNVKGWDPDGAGGNDVDAFALGGNARDIGTAYYDFTFIADKTAIAFDIEYWHPQSTGTTLEIVFKNGDTDTINLSQTGFSEDNDEVFVGLTSDVPFASLRLYEPFETDQLGRSTGRNEEVSIDNIYTADAVPEPASLALLTLAGGVLIRRR